MNKQNSGGQPPLLPDCEMGGSIMEVIIVFLINLIRILFCIFAVVGLSASILGVVFIIAKILYKEI